MRRIIRQEDTDKACISESDDSCSVEDLSQYERVANVSNKLPPCAPKKGDNEFGGRIQIFYSSAIINALCFCNSKIRLVMKNVKIQFIQDSVTYI